MKKITQIIFSSLILLNISFCSKAMAPKSTATSTKATVSSTQTPATAAQASQQLAQANKNLILANKAYEYAKTPAEKKQARKDVLEAAKGVLNIASAHRNLQGELIGYQDEEKEEAQNVLDEMTIKRDVLQKVVDDLKKQRAALENKGWIWNSVKTEKKKEHASITKKINKLEPTLNELDAKVREQAIIAGEQKFTKTRAFAIASIAAVTTAAGLYLYLGPVVAKSEYEKFKGNPRQYLSQRASSFKNWFGGLLGGSVQTTITEQAAETAVQTITKKFGGAVGDLVREAFTIGRTMVLSAAMAKLINELMKLIQDNAPEEEIVNKANEIKQAAVKESQKSKNN